MLLNINIMMNVISGFNPNANNPNLSVDDLKNKYIYDSTNDKKATFNHQIVAINRGVMSGIGKMIDTIKASNSKSLSGFVLKLRVVHQLKNAMKSLEKLVGKFESGKVEADDIQNKYEAYSNKFSIKFNQLGNKLKLDEGVLQKNIFSDAKAKIADEKKERAEALVREANQSLIKQKIGGQEVSDKGQVLDNKNKNNNAIGQEKRAIVDEIKQTPKGNLSKVKSHAKFAGFTPLMKKEVNITMKGDVKKTKIEIDSPLSSHVLDGKSSHYDRQKYIENATMTLTQVAKSLAGLHAKGLAHADVRPENILIRLGKETSDTNKRIQSTITDPGTVQTRDTIRKNGTYMAPEVIDNILDGKPVGNQQAADVYSFGVTIFETCFGDLSFKSLENIVQFDADLDLYNLPDDAYLWAIKDNHMATAEALSKVNDLKFTANSLHGGSPFGGTTVEQNEFILKLVRDCTKPNPKERLTMAQVGGILEKIQEGETSYEDVKRSVLEAKL